MFQGMLRASIIGELQETESGRDYLKKCERLNQTELDEGAFRSRIRMMKERS
ncbi:MAG: hypothetical protein PHT58_07210 [Eubacteriales bacterium]|nr:hypothetical protein [Eubacteriales bacterium]